jgi:hypothetical protein
MLQLIPLSIANSASAKLISWVLSPVMVSGGDCKSLVLVPSLFESESTHQIIWLVRIMVITSDCLSDHGSSILPRVAKLVKGKYVLGLSLNA